MDDHKDIARSFNGEVLPKRTPKQNNSLHGGCTMFAVKLNDAGIDQKMILEQMKSLKLPNTMHSIKSMIQAIALAMFGTPHTSDLNTKQISQVWEVLMHNMTKIFGPDVFVPFPSEEEKYYDTL